MVALVSAMVLSRLFTKADYATYRQTLLVYMFAVPFVMLGFNQALLYFLPRRQDAMRRVLRENLLLLGGGGLVLSLFLVAGGNKLLASWFGNPALEETLLILAPYPLLMFLAAGLPACLLAQERAGQVAVFNVVSRIGLLALVLLPCLLWPWPSPAIIGTVVAAYLTTAVALLLMFRACPSGESRPTLSGIKEQILFAVPLGLAMLTSDVIKRFDKVIVAAMCSSSSFALYVNGAVDVPMLAIVTGSVTSVLLVDFAKLHEENRTAEMIPVIRQAILKCGLILFPVMTGLLAFAPEFMRFLFGPDYEASAPFFCVYLLLIPRRALVFGAIIVATGHTGQLLWQHILLLVVNAVATVVGVMVFGPIGAAIASVGSIYLVALPYQLFLTSRIVKCPMSRLGPWSELCKIMVLSAVPAIALGYFKHLVVLPDYLLLSMGGILFVVMTGALFVCFQLVSLPDLYRRVGNLFSYASTRQRP